MRPDTPLILSLPADVKWLGTARRVVEAAAQQVGFSQQAVYEVTLAVHEACSNVIEHAYAGRSGETLSIACRAGGGGLEVLIRDRGQPFDISQATELPPDELRDGGRGVFLIRRLMHEVESRQLPDGGNELRLFRRSE